MSASTTPPAVTVLMPVYNAGPYLLPAIESVRAQTFTDWELLVVDDGSTDGSREVCQQAAAEDARIRVLSRPNTGITGALNDGFKLARGALIARLDADDLATPDRLMLQVNYLQSHPECVVVGGQATQIDSAGRPLGPIQLPLEHEEILGQLLSGRGSVIIHAGCTLRATDIHQVGGYRPEFEIAEDLDLFLRLSEVGRLANLPKQVVIVRRHLGSLTALSRRQDAFFMKLQIVTAARARRGEPFDPRSVRMIAAPASQAEAYAAWMLTALRAGNWRTAAAYAWFTFAAGIFQPREWPAIFRRGLFALLPNGYRQRWEQAQAEKAVADWEAKKSCPAMNE